MQRFRLMSLYVVFVVAALGLAVAGIAGLRAAVTHGTVTQRDVDRATPADGSADVR